MEVKKYILDNKINAIYGDVNGLSWNDFFHVVAIKNHYENITVEKYVIKSTSCSDKKVIDSLKLVHLEENILGKKMSVLSSSEKLKIELAILLIENVSCFLFPLFDCYFMDKELLFFKGLFRKLVREFNKTFVFLNSRQTFLYSFADRVVIMKSKKKMVVLDNPTFYEEELSMFLEEMPIVDFVKYTNSCGKKILEYTNLNELLKAIFREV